MKKVVCASIVILTMIGGAYRVEAYWNEYFMPYVGISLINDHPDPNYDIRFTNQDMFWKSSNLAAYNYTDDTYEHETIFYNYDGNAFATTFINSNWWSSTLPDPYLDTQAFDDENEPNITVGTFDPTDIEPDTYYNLYVALENTNSSASRYKIQGQKGYSHCEISAWCVENQDTVQSIPFTTFMGAPEYRTFRNEVESNDTKPVADRISLGQWGSGVIASAEDDFFVFYVPSAQTVDMKLRLNEISSPNNYDLEIYRESTNQWVAGSYNSAGNDESISTYLVTDDYYAKIYPAAGSDDDASYHFIAY
jgi:hypothetical protein